MTFPVVDDSPIALARLLLSIIENDRSTFELIDRYVDGDHDKPYMPATADQEYRQLAERSVSNWMPLLLETPCQALYVDAFRRGHNAPPGAEDFDSAAAAELPEWIHWQESRLDARQLAIHRGALKYGHSFTLTERDAKRNKVLTKGLSALNTAAVYIDPANDIDPFAALTIVRYPSPAREGQPEVLGGAYLWDSTFRYAVTFKSTQDMESVAIIGFEEHGSSECPVTRFAAQVDLEGRTRGVIKPNIPVQNRINQSVFDLLVAQTGGAFKIRTISGMAPPMKRWTQAQIDDAKAVRSPSTGFSILPPDGTEPGDPIIDPETGKPIPEPTNLNARKFFFAEDKDVEFGSLDETPLDGYIRSLDMSIRHLAAMTQTPPHYLLGEIANLSAEALQAAETALLRSIEEYKKSFGESWERVFRLAAELADETISAMDYAGEVLWRDVEMRSLSAYADGLAKLSEGIKVPRRGLWARVPQVTRTELEEWERLRVVELDEYHAEQRRLLDMQLELVRAQGEAQQRFTTLGQGMPDSRSLRDDS